MDKKLVEKLIELQREAMISKSEWVRTNAKNNLDTFFKEFKNWSSEQQKTLLDMLKKANDKIKKQINESIFECEIYGYNRTKEQIDELKDLGITRDAIETLIKKTEKDLKKNSDNHLHFGR